MKYIEIIKSWSGKIILLITAAFTAMSNIQLALVVLFFAITIDFLSGWLATYMEIHRGEKALPKSGYSFESKRARETGVKAVGYITLILGFYVIEYLYIDKKFDFTHLSSKPMGITEIMVGICIAIEIYSTVVENFKRAGFDVIAKVTSLIDAVWKIIKKVKGNE